MRRVGLVLRDVVFIDFDNLCLLTLYQYTEAVRARSCKVYLQVWVVSTKNLTDNAADGQQGHREEAEEGLHRGIVGLLSFVGRESPIASGVRCTLVWAKHATIRGRSGQLH